MKVCISGLTAVGKTYIAKKVAQAYGLRYISASTLLLDGGLLLGYSSFKPKERKGHFWLTPHADLFNLERSQDYKLDKKIDCLLLDYIERESSVIVDTLTTPVLMSKQNNAFNILIVSSLETRTRRAWLSSQTLTLEKLSCGVSAKDTATRNILKQVWGIDVMSDILYQSYDIVLDNSNLDDPNDLSKTGEISRVVTFEAVKACLDLYTWYIGSLDHASALLAHSKIAGISYEFPKLFKKIPKVFLGKIGFTEKYDWEKRNENDSN